MMLFVFDCRMKDEDGEPMTVDGVQKTGDR